MFNVGETIAIENMSAEVVYVHDDVCFIAKLENNTFMVLEYVDDETYYDLYEDLPTALDMQTAIGRIEMWWRENMSD